MNFTIIFAVNAHVNCMSGCTGYHALDGHRRRYCCFYLC